MVDILLNSNFISLRLIFGLYIRSNLQKNFHPKNHMLAFSIFVIPTYSLGKHSALIYKNLEV